MIRNYQASRQWQRIQKNWITEEVADDLTTFKSDRRNYKISLWNPEVNGGRYLKALIYHLGMGLNEQDWARVRRIQNREVGNPVTVCCNGEKICLDYLQATLELGFIEQEINLAGASIVEIGAGYGRTCHAILSNYDISTYTIVDLKNTMQLSRKYLQEVLDDTQFTKINFVESAEADDIQDSVYFDLCININSLAEMSPATVCDYLELIDRKCASFYVKNPVGKYLDKSITGYSESDMPVQIAMESGPLRQVLDIHDSLAVETAASDFITAYRPGEDWTCVADGWSLPWSYFWQAIYKNGRSH